ncbi:hypothetical protein FM103_03110 [Corynebacterium xerosis]|nr:hypothetical protein FM103_03110 [Corynebacterium xerosis]
MNQAHGSMLRISGGGSTSTRFSQAHGGRFVLENLEWSI